MLSQHIMHVDNTGHTLPHIPTQPTTCLPTRLIGTTSRHTPPFALIHSYNVLRISLHSSTRYTSIHTYMPYMRPRHSHLRPPPHHTPGELDWILHRAKQVPGPGSYDPPSLMVESNGGKVSKY